MAPGTRNSGTTWHAGRGYQGNWYLTLSEKEALRKLKVHYDRHDLFERKHSNACGKSTLNTIYISTKTSKKVTCKACLDFLEAKRKSRSVKLDLEQSDNLTSEGS